ncbi:MAG: Hsp20/alpha crystallin family protein [Tumebacillaceae bacterium]
MHRMPMPLDTVRHFFDSQVFPMLHQIMPYGTLGPRVEVRQKPDEILVTADIPGLERPEDLEIHVQETSVTISGEVEKKQEHEGFDLFHTERLYGKFSRTVPLPVLVDPEQVQANYRNGVLTVRLRKNTELQGRRVTVDFQ